MLINQALICNPSKLEHHWFFLFLIKQGELTRIYSLSEKMDSKNALKTWEMSNSLETISAVDEIYKYDKKQQQDILTAKPWEKE